MCDCTSPVQNMTGMEKVQSVISLKSEIITSIFASLLIFSNTYYKIYCEEWQCMRQVARVEFKNCSIKNLSLYYIIPVFFSLNSCYSF